MLQKLVEIIGDQEKKIEFPFFSTLCKVPSRKAHFPETKNPHLRENPKQDYM